MGTFPTSPRSSFLAWCTVHAPVFTANAAAIGLTPAQATAYAGAVEAAVAAESDREIKATDARMATQEATARATELRTLTRATVGIIKNFAIATDNPDVYTTADIPAPVPPGEVPPPGMPTDLSVTLIPTTGQIELRWKCINPPSGGGTAYIVRRRTNTAAPFEFVGVTGEKRFVDSTFIAGPDRVEYTVQAQRADSAGPVSNVLTINFGVIAGGPGMMIASVQQQGGNGDMKLAA